MRRRSRSGDVSEQSIRVEASGLPLEPEAPIEPVVKAPEGVSQPVLRASGDVSWLLQRGVELQREASKRNIHNVFDDNGYKELFLLTLFDLKKLHREGDDAEDAGGRRYEMKTVGRMSSSGVRKARLGVTTEHTLTLANIQRYRAVFLWIVAIFNQADAEAIYEIAPLKLEPYFAKWERELTAVRNGIVRDHINNPKIPFEFIEQNGLRVYPA